MNNIFAIRGATTIEIDDKKEIEEKSIALISEIINQNKITSGESISLIISTTNDITSYYPATSIREHSIIDVPLFSALEPPIKNALKLCIRMMLTINKKDDSFKPKHIYLNKAASLRQDLK